MKKMGLEFLKYLGTIILMIGCTYAITYLVSPYAKNPNFWISNIMLLLAPLGVMLILGFLYRKTLFKDFKKFKKEYLSIGIRYWLIGFIAMLISNLIINAIAGGIAANEAANRAIIGKFPIYAIVEIALLAPITEEITFRLAPRNIFKNSFLYALLAGTVFGYMHVMGATGLELLFIIPYGALGFALAKMVSKTDNIWTSISMHIMHNSLTLLALFMTGVI
jgi:membrane protease YdiL (CAAX protease family)